MTEFVIGVAIALPVIFVLIFMYTSIQALWHFSSRYHKVKQFGEPVLAELGWEVLLGRRILYRVNHVYSIADDQLPFSTVEYAGQVWASKDVDLVSEQWLAFRASVCTIGTPTKQEVRSSLTIIRYAGGDRAFESSIQKTLKEEIELRYVERDRRRTPPQPDEQKEGSE